MTAVKQEPKRSDYPSDADGIIAYGHALKRWQKAEAARRERERKTKQRQREDALILRYLASHDSERERIVRLASDWKADVDAIRARKKAERAQAGEAAAQVPPTWEKANARGSETPSMSDSRAQRGQVG